MIYLVHSFSESLSLVYFFFVGSFLKKDIFSLQCQNLSCGSKEKNKQKTNVWNKALSVAAVVACFYFDYGTVSTS